MTTLVVLTACGSTPEKPPAASNNAPKSAKTQLPVYGYEIVKTHPHDPGSFTQGLVFHDGFFYESAGQYKISSIRKVEVETGRVVKRNAVPPEYFAEGLTVLGGRIYQITWQEYTAFVYDMDFKLIRELRYQGDGWGLTNDGTNLVMSDGTHVIRFVNPENFETVRSIIVRDERGQPVYNLNELEWVKGEIWANIWHSDRIGKPNHIARIDPSSGNIVGWINLSGISPDDVNADPENTLNGIAYDPATDRIWVTGKRWKKLFEIKLKDKTAG